MNEVSQAEKELAGMGLRKVRKIFEVSAKELSQRINCKPNTLYAVENGHSQGSFNVKKLEDAAQVFGMTVTDLLDIETECETLIDAFKYLQKIGKI